MQESENIKLVQVRNFITFELKVFRHEERETPSFYADCFYIVSSQPNQRAAPEAHKVVWPRPGLNLDSLVRRQELNPLLFLKSQLPVRDVIHIPWLQFQSGIFILTSLNDTSSQRAHEHLCRCCTLHNPCAKRKVHSLTKPKGKIYKTKSLSNYITILHSIQVKRIRHAGHCWKVRKN